VKNKKVEESNVNNKELSNIFISENKTQETKKGGFSFIKNGKNTTENKEDDLNNVFQNLNVVGSKSDSKGNTSESLSKSNI
jgi:hypothetical protein